MMGRVRHWGVLAVCLCSIDGVVGTSKSAQTQKTMTLASLGENFKWNCQTAGHAGTCAKLNRTMATYALIDELDIGVVTNFLPDDAARGILEKMKVVPESEWTQIDNRQARAFGKNNKAYKASVDMDYKMYDLQLPKHLELRAAIEPLFAPYFQLLKHLRELRAVIEPLFAPYFQGQNQKLSLFLGRYKHGSYVTAHTDGAVVTLNGLDRYERKRAFLLYLNEAWSEQDGGLFTDEEDKGHPHYTPGWNTLLTFRVPRWHLVTPVKAHKVRWSIYGWSLEEQPSDFQAFMKFVQTKPLQTFAIVLAFLGLVWLMHILGDRKPPSRAVKNE